MFTIKNPEALLHVILFIFALWVIAFSFKKDKSGDDYDRGN
jgi:hypothetical protein